tara:strand:+ start:2162 stop:4699 length:2538 start_codon:yes stop_codon:yes gene_type:complete
MATKRSKIAQQESEFYGGAVKEAWGDLYGEADYGGGDFFKGFPIKDLAKWGIPYLLLKNWGEKEVDKKTNAALARANSGLLEIQQQKALRLNDIDRMSIVSGREAKMRDDGIGNVEDYYNIMHQIVGEISPNAVADFKALFEAQAAINEDATAATTYSDPVTALEQLDNQVKKEAIRKYKEHDLISKQYIKARVEGFMPMEDVVDAKGDVIRKGAAQGYLDKVNAAEEYMLGYIKKVTLDAQSLNWVDGILLKFGIKKMDRSVISTKITQQAVKNTTAEVMGKFSFAFPYSELDEELRLEVQNRVAANMFSYETTDANGKKIIKQIPLSKVTPAMRYGIANTIRNNQAITAIIEEAATDVLSDVTGIKDANAITKSIESDAFKIRIGREKRKETLIAHNDLMKTNDILLADPTESNKIKFNKAFKALYDLEQKNLEDGFGPDFYTSFADKFGDVGTKVNENAELEFMSMWDPLLQSGNLAPYQIRQLKSLKQMIFSKNKLFADSSLPDSQKESGYNPYTTTNEGFITGALLNSANRVTLIAKGEIANFVLHTRPDLESQWDAVNKKPIAGSELADIMRIVKGRKGPYIAISKLIADVTGRKGKEERPYATILEGHIRDVSKLYIMDGYLPGDATQIATLDVLAVTELISGTGVQTNDAIALLNQSANVIKGKAFEKDELGQLPLWSRLVNPEDLAALRNGNTNGVTLQDRYEQMANTLDNEAIDDLVVLGERYREFITGTGEYDPNDVKHRKGLRPLNDLIPVDQAKVLLDMASELMRIDGTLQERIRPFYDAIMRSAVPTGRKGLYDYTIGASDEVAKLQGLLLQEFTLAGNLRASETYKRRKP